MNDLSLPEDKAIANLGTHIGIVVPKLVGPKITLHRKNLVMCLSGGRCCYKVEIYAGKAPSLRIRMHVNVLTVSTNNRTPLPTCSPTTTTRIVEACSTQLSLRPCLGTD